MRVFARLSLALVLLAVLLSGCTGATPTPASVPPTQAPAVKPAEPTAAPATVDTLRFTWFTDGPDQPAIEAVIKDFEVQNPDIKVELSIVPYAELNQLLTTQAEAGKAPDLARVSEPYRFFNYTLDLKPYLKDATFPQAFLDDAMAITSGPKGEVYGIPHDFTLNGPFINVSLVTKAGLELPKGDKVTWQEWVDLAKKVKQATGVPYAVAVDRSGHRLDGFIQAMGGGYFTPDGKDVRINSPETKKAIDYFVNLNKDGTMPLEVWAGGGQGYADAKQLFVNQQLVFYVSGNWQMAFFNSTIGDKFEWKAVSNGFEQQYGSMPGGKFVIAFKNTKTPEKVARLMEYLGSKKAMADYVSKALFLPTRKDLVKEGLQYPMRSDDMGVFVKDIANLPKSAYVDNYNFTFGPVANEVRDRVTQAIVDQMTVDQALEAAQTKAKELIKQ